MFRKAVDSWVVAGDVVALVAFAAIGRQSHNESNPLGAIVATALPFIVGWLMVAWPSGMLIPHPMPRWILRTLLVNIAGCGFGLMIRSVWLQREIPMSFAVVSFLATSALLVIARLIQFRRSTKEVIV